MSTATRPLRRRKKLAFAALSVGIALLTLEGALRLAGYPRGLVRSFSRVWNRDPASLARVPGLFEPGVSRRIAYPPDLAYTARFNALGLRGDELPPAAEGVVRVLALGDSVTFGYHVADADTYPARLQARLGPRAQVINAGCGHFTITDERLYATERLLALEPDVVVLQFCSNDVLPSELERSPPLYRRILEEAQGESLGDRLRETALGELQLRLAIALKGLGREPALSLAPMASVPREAWARYEEELVALKRALAARGASLVLVSFPDLVATLDPASTAFDGPLGELAARAGVPFCSALPAFRAAGGDPRELYLWPRDPHPSARGNAVLAGSVEGLLHEHGLGPD